MKALTLTQPWASLIAVGAKRVETRSWGAAYRGPLAIHAAARFPRAARDVVRREPFITVLSEHFGTAPLPVNPYDLPTGGVVAIAQLVDVVTTDHMLRMLRSGVLGAGEFEVSFGDYSPGRYAWLLADVHPLSEPVAVRGALGLWDWASARRGGPMTDASAACAWGSCGEPVDAWVAALGLCLPHAVAVFYASALAAAEKRALHAGGAVRADAWRVADRCWFALLEQVRSVGAPSQRAAQLGDAARAGNLATVVRGEAGSSCDRASGHFHVCVRGPHGREPGAAGHHWCACGTTWRSLNEVSVDEAAQCLGWEGAIGGGT